MKQNETERVKRPAGRGRSRKPYTIPRLTAHGDVRELTRALGGGGNDGQGGSQVGDVD